MFGLELKNLVDLCMYVVGGNRSDAPAEEGIKEEEERKRKKESEESRMSHGSVGLAETKTKTKMKTRTRTSIEGEGLTWVCKCFHLVRSGRRL